MLVRGTRDREGRAGLGRKILKAGASGFGGKDKARGLAR
jgi:hypothetical protein